MCPYNNTAIRNIEVIGYVNVSERFNVGSNQYCKNESEIENKLDDGCNTFTLNHAKTIPDPISCGMAKDVGGIGCRPKTPCACGDGDCFNDEDCQTGLRCF